MRRELWDVNTGVGRQVGCAFAVLCTHALDSMTSLLELEMVTWWDLLTTHYQRMRQRRHICRRHNVDVRGAIFVIQPSEKSTSRKSNILNLHYRPMVTLLSDGNNRQAAFHPLLLCHPIQTQHSNFPAIWSRGLCKSPPSWSTTYPPLPTPLKFKFSRHLVTWSAQATPICAETRLA